MKIDQELAEFSPSRDSVLTIGVFDGVHQGHRHLIDRLTRVAADADMLSGVVTFRNHPKSVVRPDFKPRYITALDERLRLINQLGVSFVVPITFDLDLSMLRPEPFILRLQRLLRMRGMVVGPDFAMGHDREGDVETLTVLGKGMGVSVSVVDYFVDKGEALRSTTIRDALTQGDVGRVADMLGRNFVLTGRVVRGVGRGKNLGFPTANLEAPTDMAIPGDGIYATWAHLGERCLKAATSIGTRPTFEEGEHTIEAFVLDFEEDLYNTELRLEFVKRLRDEVKYDTADALQVQMDMDVNQARSVLEMSPPNPR